MNVFVYGTLKRGYHNHRVLGNSEFIGRAVTLRPFFMKCCGFPVVFRGPATANVEGELYNVTDPEIERALDRLEGVPHMYTRERVQVDCPDLGKQVDAEIYLGNPNNWTDLGRLRTIPVTPHGTYIWADAR